MTRTSTAIGRLLPSRVNSLSCSTRSSLACSAERHLADLVEQHRAAVGELELADPRRLRAGERALLVAEQLALEQLGRQRRAVDLDERLSARAPNAGAARGR